VLESYVESVGRCTTGNELNRLHVGLETRLVPLEVAQLITRVRNEVAKLPEGSVHWLAWMGRLMSRSALPLQAYAREELGEAAVLHAVPAPAEVRRQRTLVIAYTGHAKRFLLPLAPFLQHCDGARYEFLVLADGSRHAFMRGIEGMADDMPGLIAHIDRITSSRGHRRIVAFGTSSGGFAALWTAVALGLGRGVSIGGPSPDHVNERGTGDVDFAPFTKAVAERAGRLPELLYVFGELHERDRAKGRAHERFVPITPIELPGIASHGGLFDLLKRRELTAMLERLLGEA